MWIDTSWFMRELGLSQWLFFGWFNLIAAKALFIYFGIRRGLGIERTLQLAMAYTVGAVLGVLLFNSVMGLLLVGAVFYLAFSRLTGLGFDHSDLLAVNFAVAVGVGRFGCLFSGCCFGQPTDLPWGLQYPFGSLPHFLHWETGQLESFRSFSLAVHPLPLYESLFLFTAAVLMLIIGWRRPAWRRFFLPLFLGHYFALRFFAEGIRAHSHSALSAVNAGPMDLFRVFLLTAIVGCVLWTYRMLRVQRRVEKEGSQLLFSANLFIAAGIFWVFRGQLLPVQSSQLAVLIFFNGLIMAMQFRVYGRRRLSMPGSFAGLWRLQATGLTAATAVTVLFLGASVYLTAQDRVEQGIETGLNEKREAHLFIEGKTRLLSLPSGVATSTLFRENLSSGRLRAVEGERGGGEDVETVPQWKLSGEGGYFQIETCSGVQPFLYSGAAITGVQTRRLSSGGSLQNSFRISSMMVGGNHGGFMIPTAGVMVTGRGASGAAGIGVQLSYIGGSPIVLPSALIELGSKRSALRLAFNDHGGDYASPWNGELGWTWMSGTGAYRSAGFSNFLFMPAMYFGSRRDGVSWKCIFWPPLFDESAGIGFRYSRDMTF